jgi:ribonuclease BN (tRNA processing enzyme)
LLRARAFADDPAPPLPVYAPPGALDAVLALDSAETTRGAADVRELRGGERLELGPFAVTTCSLPHWVPNVGIRLTAGGRTLAYTGDTGPTRAIVELARGADVFLAEATRPAMLAPDSARDLSTARGAGVDAAAAGVGRLILTHLWPGEQRSAFLAEAAKSYGGDVRIASSGLVVDL